MSEMLDEDYDWQPPSEAELKILQARRERSDKISKLMGDYLLKGYKMLGVTCPECSTILLQDKQGTNYCIACRELDTDTDKDDPVLSSDAARSQIREGTVTDITDTDDLSFMRREPVTASTSHQPGSHLLRQEPAQTVTPSPYQETAVSSSVTLNQSVKVDVNFADSVDVLSTKIKWATEELRKTQSLEYSITLCQLIKSASEAIHSLKHSS